MKKKTFYPSGIIVLFLLLSIYLNPVIAQGDPSNIKEAKTKPSKEERKKLNKEALKGRRFKINTVLTYATLNSEIRITGPNGVLGATISFEDLLGFDKTKFIPSLDIQYSFTRHSGIYAEYYSIRRDSKFIIDEEFEFGDYTVPINTEIRAFMNMEIWSVGYMYSFINDEKASLSAFINFFILRWSTGLDLDSRNISKRVRFTAPLPSFGYKFSYEIAPKLRFGATHSFFFLEIGGFKGNINNLKLSMDYEATSWLRAGVAYSVFLLDLSVNADKFTGDYNYGYQGPGVYAQFVF
jgi:hypothetical protein